MHVRHVDVDALTAHEMNGHFFLPITRTPRTAEDVCASLLRPNRIDDELVAALTVEHPEVEGPPAIHPIVVGNVPRGAARSLQVGRCHIFVRYGRAERRQAIGREPCVDRLLELLDGRSDRWRSLREEGTAAVAPG